MELESMYDSDMSSTRQDHVEELSMEDLDDHAHDLKSTPSMISTTALTASTSPKMADGSDQSWLRRLERDMDTKLLVDAERINERIQRRKAHEEEMQQSLASFTNSARVSASSSSAAAPSAHSPENAIVVNRSATAAPTPVDHSMVGTSTDSVATPATTTTTTTTVTMHQSKKSMFCMFCGLECRVWELMPHMSSCDLLRTNKAQRTAMYEEAVDIASALLNKQTSDADTQTTDRYLHYASLYSLHHDDSSRDQRGNVLDPLALLKQRRRHTMQPTTTSSSSTLRRHQRDDDDDHDVMHLNVDDDTKLSLLRLKRSTEAAQSRRQDVSEQCRYCHRSFAEVTNERPPLPPLEHPPCIDLTSICNDRAD
ncbi:hypothetical protein DYB26_009197 [Aphanomyces astaci]|uniref:Uncharacterized protein n=1 Tax=Aphanomyces astaci TaxID=112090 RepID=A0A3R7FKJ3_APHAT|nr:hypothetical protein DYB26_009197 [Aphanomyces astaci]